MSGINRTPVMDADLLPALFDLGTSIVRGKHRRRQVAGERLALIQNQRDTIVGMSIWLIGSCPHNTTDGVFSINANYTESLCCDGWSRPQQIIRIQSPTLKQVIGVRGFIVETRWARPLLRARL